MPKTAERLQRALVAAQVALLEHLDEDVGAPPDALAALDLALKEAVKCARDLRREEV